MVNLTQNRLVNVEKSLSIVGDSPGVVNTFFLKSITFQIAFVVAEMRALPVENRCAETLAKIRR
jgi:hypothetical protein